jgi:hypothetical protein
MAMAVLGVCGLPCVAIGATIKVSVLVSVRFESLCGFVRCGAVRRPVIC